MEYAGEDAGDRGVLTRLRVGGLGCVYLWERKEEKEEKKKKEVEEKEEEKKDRE